MWDLPGPGLEPMSPALAGGFLTTVPPGKSLQHILNLSAMNTYYSYNEKRIQFKFILFIYLFYFWLRWVFLAAHGLSLTAVTEGYSSLRCACFSLQWRLLLQSMGSRRTGFSSCGTQASVVVAHRLSSCGSRALEHRLSSCGARA